MTADEVMGIFHTTHDSVPNYEVVPILYSSNAIHKNGTRKMRVKTFNRNIELTLNPTEGYLASIDTPLWTVRSGDQQAPEGLHYTLIPKALQDIGTPMQDEKSEAAVLVASKNKYPTFDGFLSSNFVIRSLPQRVIDLLYGKERFFEFHFDEEAEMENLMYTYHHIVYEKIREKNYERFQITNPLNKMYPIPDVVYPEILIVVDYALYASLGGNIDQAKRYIVAFWNGVDLRYRALTKPKIRLNIAGIIIATDMKAVPYIENSRLKSNLVDADQALTGMSTYFYREKRFPWKMYDIAMATTHLNLCNKLDEYLCDPETLGYAFVRGACNRNSTTKTSEAVGIAEDNGGFSGIIPVAHELGHLLGAHHDGTTNDTKKCPASDGYMMTGTLQLSENQFKWSICSIRALQKFLSEDTAKCLYDEPPKATAIRRLMPGKLMSLDSQCKKVYGGIACKENESEVCYRLECEVPDSNGVCAAVAAAAEGSSCGTNLICLDGQCVLEGTEVKHEKGIQRR
ncbi:A disintegrin and metalloproteinase with thrombospondin motifs like [Nomia melanderi]|uniref:A disintegrin and metalloproteinase with thrombospondin motifs like n=1 Tax=Nomia melanderi TaxID=2448451 RepID=UPI003FCE6D51